MPRHFGKEWGAMVDGEIDGGIAGEIDGRLGDGIDGQLDGIDSTATVRPRVGRWVLAAAVGVGCYGSASTAAAAEGTSTYTLEDLADKTLMVQTTGGRLKAGEQSAGMCKVKVSGSGSIWTIEATGDGSECGSLWRNERLAPRTLQFPAAGGGKMPVRFELAPARASEPGPLTLTLDEARRVQGLDQGRAAYAYAAELGWYALTTGADAKAELRGATLEGLDDDESVWIGYAEVDERGTPVAHHVVPLTVVAPTPTPPSTGGDVGSGSGGRATGSMAPPACNPQSEPNTAYVCAWVEGTTIRFEQAPPPVIRPNISVEVEVIHPSDVNVDVRMTGKRGLFMPGDRITGVDGDAQSDSPRPPPVQHSVRHRFAPRAPGDADVEITITDDEGRIVASRSLEFVVDRTYAGAVRLGFGIVYADAVDRHYEARTIGTNEQAQIVATRGGNSGFELVLGYAPYLFDYIQNRGHGRSYTNTTLRDRAGGFAPFAGLGLVEASDTGVEILKSLHMGLEWEPTPNFSIAATAVSRRVTRLTEGARVGDPVTGEVPTREVIRWGGGVVLSFSTDFFRIATRESRSPYRANRR